MVMVAGHKTLFSSLVLFNCLKDRDTPAWARGVIVGALGYLILPTDLIPDMLPGAGYGDDWSTIVAALGIVAAYIKETHKLRAKEQLDKLFGSRNTAAPTDFVE
ncbi:MAG: YkvA family protein [Verrucomicrobia bacterium]|nr:YkvA family protein [Verrucomicrobiota bacterium]